MTVSPWHHFVFPFRRALADDDRPRFEATLAEALGGDHVIRGDGMLIDGNEHGRSYNAMGQSDMGLYLVRAAAQWDEPAFLRDGLAAMEVMLRPYEAGGLRLHDAGADASWYCGKTSRDATDKGATLNKHLYATRTFLQVAAELETMGLEDEAARMRAAGEAGFRKLVLGENGPVLADYFVDGPGAAPFLLSWVYYGSFDARSDGGYFLKNDRLNADYHLYDMELIHQIAQLLPEAFDWSPFHVPAMDGLTPFGAMLQVYRTKLGLGGLELDHDLGHGRFSALPADKAHDLPPETKAWFADFLDPSTLRGGGGDDRLRGTGGRDTILAGGGSDTVRGSEGADTLLGGRGADTLAGGAGDDILLGGRGRDVLVGGGGADVFWFTPSEASGTGRGADRIVDFTPGEDIVAIVPLAGIPRAGDLPPSHEPLVFVGGAAFSGTAGELRYAGGRLQADLDGDGAADMEIRLRGAPDLGADDLLL